MLRGNTTLFTNIFEDAPIAKQRKGRSLTLITKRNECLIDRYYFYGKFCEKRYSRILTILSDEFFISPVTIPEIITANDTILHGLKKEQPTIRHFEKKWPHFVWDIKAVLK